MPYALPNFPDAAWTALPDAQAQEAFLQAARRFWRVPDAVDVLAVPGASAAIAQIPRLAPAAQVFIPGPTYNEHAASFRAGGWTVSDGAKGAMASVHVHPNNPDGRRREAADLAGALRIIDESFCDVMPEASLIGQSANPGTLVLKSFGKFWGLAGLRLGLVAGDRDLVGRLAEMLGPWPVSGPALAIGTRALDDEGWADATRLRLAEDAARLDGMLQTAGAVVVGGTSLFRLYEVDDAADWQARLGAHHIWSRIFPYNRKWLRLGLPPADGWARLDEALR